uniref:BTB domain-containing protein n=1 Tax=Magallana gigas TaxID=29159 RepID=K1QUF0_MAGGI
MKAHIKAGAYIPGFMGAKRMKAIDIPLDERPVHRRITPSLEDFRELVTFVHCGKVNINASNVTGLYCGATEFSLSDLKIACRDFTTKSIRKGHTSTILKSAKFYLGLHGAATKFVEKIRGYQKSVNG